MKITVIEEVREERARQDAKWGEQNHPDGTGPYDAVLHPIGGELQKNLMTAEAMALAQAATNVTNKYARRGIVTWRDILLEEVFEAMAESDPDRLRTELIQVAAVATQWAEAIDRRSE